MRFSVMYVMSVTKNNIKKRRKESFFQPSHSQDHDDDDDNDDDVKNLCISTITFDTSKIRMLQPFLCII